MYVCMFSCSIPIPMQLSRKNSEVPFNIAFSLITNAETFLCVKWDLSSEQEQFWLDVLTDATNDSCRCQ